MRKYYIILTGIILIAAFLRFYTIGTNPPSLTWDEVAWGYNGYSLGIDGKDEFGRFLPFTYLESFGDFKPPMYAYLTVLPVMLFGLTEFATRFASAFFGLLTVLITYFLTKEIFIKSKNPTEKNTLYREWLALTTAGIVAISPWHIMLSRAAFEANVATFFIASGVWLFLIGLRRKPWVLSVSAIAFVASIYTFNSTRIVAPLLIFCLGLVYWRRLWEIKKSAIIAAILGLLLVLPTVPFLVSPQARLRFHEVNIFSDITVIEVSNKEIVNDGNSWWSSIIHNRRVLYAGEFIEHYFDHLTPTFLFITGDENPKFSLQAVGQLYIWQAPFLIIGLLFLFRRREGHWWIIPVWILIALIPAGVARETPHALRIGSAVIPVSLLVAYGLLQAFFLLKPRFHKIPLRKVFVSLLLICSALSVVYFWENYSNFYPKYYSKEWQYGYKEALAYARSVEKEYAMISLTQALGRPYIYALFYNHISPEQFRKDAIVSRDSFGFVTVKQVGKYYFGHEFLPANDKKRVLFIDAVEAVPKEAKIQKTFYLLNGQPILVAYTLD